MVANGRVKEKEEVVKPFIPKDGNLKYTSDQRNTQIKIYTQRNVFIEI